VGLSIGWPGVWRTERFLLMWFRVLGVIVDLIVVMISLFLVRDES